ncbi:MAG: helix-turn-helix transcriptional regulator [Thermaerobacter sp.]|jgi:transcriptional regulator with XRE-family HTH domain|nr:helix-turn-helix transcriptional regulator [Thermaerobacter sp.]
MQRAYIGRVLREMLAERGMTQAEAARLAGMSRVQLGRLARDVESPTLGYVLALERALGLPCGTLACRGYGEEERLPQGVARIGRPPGAGRRRGG